jgi:branched-chain amino acid transport system ATP-binding protein
MSSREGDDVNQKGPDTTVVAGDSVDATTTAGAETTPLLEAKDVDAGYAGVPAIHDLNLSVRPGEIVALLGANGAGKSTTLLTLAGELKPIKGHVYFDGQETRKPLNWRARHGMRLITEERSVIMSLSVADNLKLLHKEPDRCIELFPELKPLMKKKASLLSGGEQQILTLARAISGDGRLLLADELSLGLAPLVSDRLLVAVRKAADRGMGVLLVEQRIGRALKIADRAYVLRLGRVVMEGTGADLQGRLDEIEALYLSASL